MISADQALQRLRDGNARFVAGDRGGSSLTGRVRRGEVASAQEPFAMLLGCSDSRVPPEDLFVQGLGDLFVVRVAGHVVGSTVLGSLEFAAEQLGSRLIVVLGHSRCGAVTAALDTLLGQEGPASPNLGALVRGIRPSVESLLSNAATTEWDAFLADAVRAHVRATIQRLPRESTILANQVRDQGLRIVGAEYSLDTGVVDFFDT